MPDTQSAPPDSLTLAEGLVAARAKAAAGARDEAILLLGELAARYPDEPMPLLHKINLLMQANRLEEADRAAGSDAFPDNAALAIAAARMAQLRRDLSRAAALWQGVRERFPGEAVGFANGAACLRDMRRFAEADALAADGIARFPQSPHPAVEHAWIAHAQRHWAEALRRWEIVRAQFPDHASGYTGAALAAREQGDEDGADRLVADGLARLPDDPSLAAAHAAAAQRQRQWHEALQRWAEVNRRFPDHPGGHVGSATALRELGQIEEAEAIANEAVERFPDFIGATIEHAQCAHARQDWTEAAARWSVVRARAPGSAVGYVFGAIALLKAGRLDVAEALIVEGAVRFPNDAGIAVWGAHIAEARHSWREALQRWEAVAERSPESAAARDGLARVKRAMPQAVDEPMPSPAASAVEAQPRRIGDLMRKLAVRMKGA